MRAELGAEPAQGFPDSRSCTCRGPEARRALGAERRPRRRALGAERPPRRRAPDAERPLRRGAPGAEAPKAWGAHCA